MNTNLLTAFRPLVLVLCAGSALGAACTAAPASAANGSELAVSYQDLNLSNTADVRVLYRRLKAAARDVCGNVPAQELARHLAFERCYNAALQSAVTQVDLPQLQAMYQSETGADSNRG
jgi:UrcA family protein